MKLRGCTWIVCLHRRFSRRVCLFCIGDELLRCRCGALNLDRVGVYRVGEGTVSKDDEH